MAQKLTSHKQVKLPVFAVVNDEDLPVFNDPNLVADKSSVTEAQMVAVGLTVLICTILAFLFIAWDMRNDSIKLEAVRREALQHKVDTERKSFTQIESIKEIIECK